MFDGVDFRPERPQQESEPELGRLSFTAAILITAGLIATVCLIILVTNRAGVSEGANASDFFTQAGLLG